MKSNDDGDKQTRTACGWSYSTPSANPIEAAVFELSESRSGQGASS